MSTLKWGQRSSSAIIGAFLQTVFLFSLWSNNKMFLNSKKGRSLSEGLNLHVIIKETPLEASFYGFYEDKHTKFCAIMTEILPHLG